ncbi:MAG: cupin domain-containing protein [Proteobacteria bacterium]|nr:cupin domain-containing protein [Pseudomonadota bacterium]
MDRATFEAELVREGYEPVTRRMDPNEVRPEHVHDFDARLLVLDGSMTIVSDGTARAYAPGETFAIPAGHRHAEQTGPEGTSYIAGRRTPRSAA